MPHDPLQATNQWRNVLWSDETKINLFGMDGKQFVRRPKGEAYNSRYTKPTVKHGGGSVMIWGCFSLRGVGPVYLIEGILTKETYVDILRNVMLPWAEENMPLKWRFQQDNDPKHSAKLTKLWFEQNNVDVLQWPSQSPDLNPIENLWNELKIEVSKRHLSKKADLWRVIQEVWYSIPSDKCQQLVNSMSRRVDSVITNKGFITKY